MCIRDSPGGCARRAAVTHGWKDALRRRFPKATDLCAFSFGIYSTVNGWARRATGEHAEQRYFANNTGLFQYE